MRAAAIALSGPGFHWEPGEVEVRVAERAAGLAGPDPLVLNGAADAEFVIECLAAWRSGRVVAPLHPDLPAAERTRAEAALASTRLPRGSAAVIWTSGTSGEARGVILGWEGLAHVARATVEHMGVGRDDVWALTLNPAHMGGWAVIARAAATGHGIWVGGGGGLAALDAAAEAGAFQFVSLVPTQLGRWLALRAGSPAPAGLRGVLLGGAAAPPDLVREARARGFPVFATYGMTEASSQVATGTPASADRDPALVGLPLPGVRVRIGLDGEVLVAGPTLALGSVGSSEPLTDAEGWYHTGDLGAFDDEGQLRLLGRRSERIISGGTNVDPLEVERVLRQHPELVDVCVVGIPDVEWGERVVALVVWAREGAPLDLESWCRCRLSPAQRPRAWVEVESIPTNRSGKPDRLVARTRVLTGS